MEPVEAIVLVGGQGTRLRPMTISAPKPLLPAAGVPFLAHQLARAAASGVVHAVLATSYRADMFEAVLGDGSAFGLELDYVMEDDPLGTGGGIRNAASRLACGPDDPVLVLNGDVLSGHDIAAQLDLHRAADAVVTLHLVEVDDPTRFGCVPTDDTGRVTAFLEKTSTPVTNRINAGCYVFKRETIDGIPAGRVVSVEREIFPGLIAAGEPVLGYPDTAYWLDVGTPEAFVRASCDLVLGLVPSPAMPGPCGDALVLPGAAVDPAADLSAGTVIGAGSVIAPAARVRGSVLLDEVEVAPGASVEGCILGRGVRIGDGAVLDGAFIGEGAVIGAGNELRHGIRIWPHVQLEPRTVRFSTDA
ncbi:MAG TPA: NDP-sugar synthase [Streptosporangiaceae bacterium]|nr:NDP-sugar synthase [Streptosporangiaceae bacterium]